MRIYESELFARNDGVVTLTATAFLLCCTVRAYRRRRIYVFYRATRMRLGEIYGPDVDPTTKLHVLVCIFEAADL